MDVELFSNMVSELLLRDGEVEFPGMGRMCFVTCPASFSDRGFTLNPPYRKLVFSEVAAEAVGEGRASAEIVKLYASANGLPVQNAEAAVTRMVSLISANVTPTRDFDLPGLGRFRRMRDGTLFFVQNQDCCLSLSFDLLEPVSLKSLDVASTVQDTETVVNEPATEADASIGTATATEADFVTTEPEQASMPVSEQVPEQPEQPESDQSAEQAPEQSEQPESDQAVEQAPEQSEQSESDQSAEQVSEQTEQQDQPEPKRKVGGGKKFLSVLLVTFIIIVLAVGMAFGLLAILGRNCPEMVDPLLYDAEQLDIINMRF